MRSRILISAFLVAAAAAAAVTAADLGIDIGSIVARPVRPLHPEHYTRALARKLGLDESQQGQIRQLLKQEKTELKLLEDQQKAHYQTIKETKLKIYDLHYAMKKRVDTAEERVREILTPKQRIKFDALRSGSKRTGGRAVSDADMDAEDAEKPAAKTRTRRRAAAPAKPAAPAAAADGPVEMPTPGIYR